MLLAGCGRIGFGAYAPGAGDALVTGDAPAGLIAWLTLDDTTFRDEISGQSATCGAACPTPAPGHIAGGLQFDGASACLQLADDGRFQLQQLTIAVWAYQPAPSGPILLTQLSKTFDAVGGDDSWELLADTMTHEELKLTGGSQGNYPITSTSPLTIATWHYLVGTYDGAMGRVYVDGVLSFQDAVTAPLAYTSHAVDIGCDDNGGSNSDQVYSGILDDVQIYDRALTDTEIATLAAR